ncbi:MAG: glycine oxidase ThiO [Gammaproteobacteria bacterium]|nr:glycine oxidase ThiO [Gammaproteobacteria bacterium]
MSDYLIIGGGISGMLTARELVLSGARVRLLERQQLGRESSWAGGGILSPLYPWRYPEAVSIMADWGQTNYHQLASALALDTGIDPEWTQSGLLMLDAEERDEAVEWSVNFDTSLEYLQGSALHRCEQALADDVSEGLWMPEVAQVRNPRMMQALRADLEMRGVEISEQCEVTEILLNDSRTSVIGVDTPEGPMVANNIIVCGGAWSARLLDGLGLNLAIEPVRGQMLLYRAEPGLFSRIVLSQGHYLIPRRDGRVLVGSTVEHVGFDKSTTDQALTELQSAAVSTVPALSQYPVEQHWAGLRPGSPRGVPYVGTYPGVDGLYVNAGHYRNGVVLGLASARLLVDLATGRHPIIDPESFALDRDEA